MGKGFFLGDPRTIPAVAASGTLAFSRDRAGRSPQVPPDGSEALTHGQLTTDLFPFRKTHSFVVSHAQHFTPFLLQVLR